MGVVGALLSKMLDVLFIKVLGLPSTELPGALMAAGGDALLVDVLGALLILGILLAEVLDWNGSKLEVYYNNISLIPHRYY